MQRMRSYPSLIAVPVLFLLGAITAYSGACSSSSSNPTTPRPDSGTGPLDADDTDDSGGDDAGDDAGSCIPLGSECTDPIDCCTVVNSPGVTCGARVGASSTKQTCFSAPGSSCSSDLDCTTNTCKSGKCVVSGSGGECLTDQDCYDGMAGLICIKGSCGVFVAPDDAGDDAGDDSGGDDAGDDAGDDSGGDDGGDDADGG